MDDFILPASDTVDVYRYQDARLQADMLLMKADLSGKELRWLLLYHFPTILEKEAKRKTENRFSAPLNNLYVERREVQ